MKEPTNYWEGEVEVTINATFSFTVDGTWRAKEEGDARRMVELELSDYVGEAFRANRFDETWKTSTFEHSTHE